MISSLIFENVQFSIAEKEYSFIPFVTVTSFSNVWNIYNMNLEEVAKFKVYCMIISFGKSSVSLLAQGRVTVIYTKNC